MRFDNQYESDDFLNWITLLEEDFLYALNTNNIGAQL